jgi:diguanylate cyclase (GGDEF)-like protein
MKEVLAGAEKPKVLVIDDDKNLRKTLTDILNAKGYDVRTAENGAEGLAIFRKEPVNLALIDLKLPDMSGIDVLNRVKDESPSTQAIILTGSATLDSAIEATNKGVFSYLEKPYDIDLLMVNIRRALEKQQAEEKIARDSVELQRMNSELKVLYEISRVVGNNLEMEKLFSEVLSTLTNIGIFIMEKKGAIFVIRKNRLHLASFAGIPEAIRESCSDIRLGECLCGRAALTGEILVSKNSGCEERHTLTYTGMTPHGHIIVPLKRATKVIGVLCLYTAPDIVIDGSLLNALRATGNQLGIAIENSYLYEEVKLSSLHDPLTGLGNRRYMQMQMETDLEVCKRYSGRFAVVMLDIDHFKKYNDTYGHVEGDRLLARLSDLFNRGVRNADRVFRYGGEEFLVLLPETDLPDACVEAERLRRAVESDGRVTISLGVSAYGDAAQTGEALIMKADEALYRAKQNGRNRVEADRRPAEEGRIQP